MTLSCWCGDVNDDWYYIAPDRYQEYSKSARRKRCCSCNELIDNGAICVEFERYRSPVTDVEERIYGEDGEITIASYFMCEECGDIYFSLNALGYCILLPDSMRGLLDEYHELAKEERRQKAEAQDRAIASKVSRSQVGERLRSEAIETVDRQIRRRS